MATETTQTAPCPNCGVPVPTDATSCAQCGADFGPDSAWQPGGPKVVKPSRRFAPLTLAISLAFLVSFFFSPGQKLLSLLAGVSVLQTLAPGQRGIALAMAGYWLPAALIYLALRVTPSARRIRAKGWEIAVLALCNVVLILYVVARVFASTVEGGGASFLVMSFAGVTAMPALFVAGGLVLKLLIDTTGTAAKREAAENSAKRLGVVHAAAILALGIAPVVYAVAPIFFGPDSPFLVQRRAAKVFERLCATAGEKIVRVPAGVEGIYVEKDYAVNLERISDGVYASSNFGGMAGPLVNSGWLRFFESPAAEPGGAGSARPKYERYSIRGKTEAVEELAAPYAIVRTALVSAEDERSGTYGYELAITALATGEVIATKRYFYHAPSRRVCGHESRDRLSDSDFVQRALGLERRFESLFK